MREEFILQYQQSTGRWVDCVDCDETEKYLTLCERATGMSRQEVLSALETKKVRYDIEGWYCYCRLKPAPKKPVQTIKCDYCGRSVPISSIISASLGNSCPDCYVD